LLAVALVLDRGGEVLEAQLALARERLGERRAGHVRRLYDELAATGPEYRLPLLEIAFPALRRRPLPQLEFLVDLVRRMIEADTETDLYEFCFFRVLAAALEHAARPAAASRPQRLTPAVVRGAAVDLLRAVAWHGHRDHEAAHAAFAAGIARFGAWADDLTLRADEVPDVGALGRALDALTALTGDGRRVLVEAVGSVVLHDRRLTVAEAELLRAVCATLDCPLPPIVTAKRRAAEDREAATQKAYD
ncbi:MAG: hypothetical protein R3176_05100, partial [Woeseiaceae bacterium]|nr:hypothetical protein [Woeseiaceae bacterium]